MQARIDGPTIPRGWKWAPKMHGYDIRQCEGCGALEAWIWHRWVVDREHPCTCKENNNA